MAKQKEAWDKLSMQEKALLIKLSVDNGVSSLKLIRDTYNLYSSDLNHKYAGDTESTQNLSFIGKDRFQDIAYRIMSQSSAEKRSIKDIFKAVKDSYTNADYEINYTGADPYLFHNKQDANSRDSNWMFLYGNTKGHYTPITKEEYRGHSYAPFIKKHYPNKEVLNYYGQITPLNEVVVPTYMRPLVDFLVKNDFGTYDNWVEPSDNEVEYALKHGYHVDDVGAFRTGIGHSPSGELELQLSDLTDFGGGDYDSRYGIMAGIQGTLLNKVGNPFMLRQFIPARYSINTTEYTPGIEKTILNMARDNGVSTYDNITDTYEILGSLPEIEVYGNKKSTGGPLYPFSFEKNPFLKTPVVRYDEGGKKLDALNPGGYTDEQLNKNYLIWKTYDPTGGLNFLNYILSLNFGNLARGEENEYWKEYLGLNSAVPLMNSNAHTEWDKQIEALKKQNRELASDFYGTTPRMDYNIQALADTLMLGNMVRNYEEYDKKYNLPHIETVTEAYEQAKNILNNPNKWTQVDGEIEVNNWPFNPNISESNPLGMLANFGMKWVPEENALYMHDTYDFPSRVHKRTEIPVRPKEMKIRSKISFDPTKGSWLLRSPVNYNTEIPAKVTK